MEKLDSPGPPLTVLGSGEGSPTVVFVEPPQGPPRPAKAPTPLARTIGCTSLNIQRMATLQEEIKRVDRQLEALREGGEMEGEAKGEALLSDRADPALAHMLVVELCQLCASGDAAGVRILLAGGVDPNARDYCASPLLHIAAGSGRGGVVAALLEVGADPTARDGRGCTADEVAEENGFVELAEELRRAVAGGGREAGEAARPDPAADPMSLSKGPSSPNSQHSLPFSSVPQPMVGSLVVIMVGLPGRGKSYVGQQIRRYFQWNGLKCRVFSHQSYQHDYLQRCGLATMAARGAVGEAPVPADVGNKVILEITKDMMTFLASTDGVAILDGTNATNARRQAILRALKDHQPISQNRIIFVEIVTNDKEKIHRNIMRSREMHADPPDNFVQRYYENIARHEMMHEALNPIRDSELSYIQIQDNDVYFLNMISGWMPSRLAYMLHNFNQSQQNLYLTRAGEYVNLISGRIGGNSELTARGVAYSIALFNFFKEEVSASTPLLVMSSSSARCMQTARYFAEESAKGASDPSASNHEETKKVQLNCHVDYIPNLEDISYGDCDGLLLSDIRKTMHSTFLAIQADSYDTPWPNGESIRHVFNTRLEPHIHDIQASSTPVLVISHQTLLQGLYAYFVTKDTQVVAAQDAYQIKIPLETVVRIRIVGVHHVAEFVSLSKEVDRIELEMTGKVTRAPQFDMSKYLNASHNFTHTEYKGIAKPPK